MLTPDVYFIDVNIIYQIFTKNIWYISKILIVAYMLFYWLPVKIFPQEYTGQGVQKIVFNFIFMIAYVEVVVTFLIFIKIFTLLLFIFILIATKLAFLKWYYKKNIISLLNNLKVNIMLWILDFFDHPSSLKVKSWNYIKYKIVEFQQNLTFYFILKYILFFSVFIYIISTLISRGLYSYSDPVSDTSQFIEWMDFLQQNILYASNKTFGADFYGMTIMIFFLNIFTNIDQITIFSLYPILLLLAIYFSIYYVAKDFSGSKYIAIFAVMIHGIIFMSPISNVFLGKIVTTSSPVLIDLYGLKIYMPRVIEAASRGLYNGYIPYIRYISGMAYEHSSIFVLLNSYFLIKVFSTKLNKFLIIYALTLMLVFTFHGGGAIVLVVISILIALNAIIFGRIDISLLKKGSLSILLASVVGNMWVLSMIKYGIPQNFGAAAPILDKLLGTARNIQETVAVGFESVSIVDITKIHILFFAMLVFGYIFSLFTKKRFVNTSFILISVGIFILYFGPNIGLPLLTKQSRLSEYMFFAMMLVMTFYFQFFFYKPSFFLFKKYARVLIVFVSYTVFLFFILAIPRWMDTNLFWKNINEIEYTSIPNIILKINKQNRPFNWTVISYVQEYAKVKNKGYHLNTQNFLLRYSPEDKYLKVPTVKVYIFVENFPNPYKGMEEWYYRWRSQIQNSLKSWIAIYNTTHDNIKVYQKTKTVTVYEIDNSNYIDYLRKENRHDNNSK
ncbi:MAG: hypothetical protein L3J44_03370 [Campylobacteraceae bacterium]|nr:hypothetical protein [Campylobacteraceae bacterium]